MGADQSLVTAAKSILRSNAHSKAAFGTEAGLFARELGLPANLCGPGDIAVAHRPDEFVPIDDLAACDRFLRELCLAA